MKQKLLWSLLLGLLFCMSAFAQQRTITGTVTDSETGEALPGVNVIIKGTTNGAVTDINGKYQISASQGDVLVFQGVGLTNQEVAVTGQSTIDVRMAIDTRQLGEVVVTGVSEGTSSKKLGFAIGKINEQTLKEVPALDAANALRGKVSGVQIVQGTGIPGTAPNIRLRGSTNIQGGSNPLIIIDGIITAPGTTLADINMNDVESIEVVKGAAGASLYGSQAGNGVVQIITRRGAEKKGVTRVTYRSEVGFTDLQREYPLSNSHRWQLNPNGSFALSNPNNPATRISEPDDIMDNPYPNFRNQQEEVFGSRAFYTNYISIANSTEKTNIFASAEQLVTNGVVEGLPAFDRKNARINLDHKITDKIQLTLTGLYTNSTGPQASERGQAGVFYSTLLNEPFLDLRANNPDGTPFDNVSPNIFNNATNPLYVAANDKWTLDRNRFLGNAALSYKVTDWLRIQGQYSFDRSIQDVERYQDKGYITRNFPTGYGGSLFTSNFSNTAQIATLNAYFNKALFDNTLDVSLILRYQYEQYNVRATSLSGSQFSASGVRSAAFLDRSTVQVGSSASEIRSENVFANLRLDYKDKLIFEGLIRQDGTSTLGENERIQTFYRLSGAYRLSEDVKIPGIDEFKLRVSYGTSGQRPPVFDAQYETYASAGGVLVRNILGNADLKTARIGELETGVNIGFLKKFNFEFNYAKTVADDQILLVPLAPWFGFGFQWQNAGTLESNTIEFSIGGDLITKGDFNWNANLIGSRTRTEITKLNVPPYATDGNIGFAAGGGVANGMFRIQEGQPLGVMFGNVHATSLNQLQTNENGIVTNLFGVNGRNINEFTVNSEGYVILDGTEFTPNERAFIIADETGQKLTTKIGDSNPDFVLGFANTFSYKALSLYVLLDAQIGGDIYNSTRQLLYFNTRHADLDQSDRPEGQRKSQSYYTSATSLYNGNDPAQHFVESGAFLILREINISYNFAPSFFEKIGLSKVFHDARFSIIGRNLFTFTNYTGYNPEVALANNSASFRVDQFAYPIFRTFTAALQLRF